MSDMPKLTAEQVQRIWECGGYKKAEFEAELQRMGLFEPVDPLLIEAREIVIQDGTNRTVNQIEAIRSGEAGKYGVNLALAALKRGMELARPTLTVAEVRVAVSRSWESCGLIDIKRLHAALTGETAHPAARMEEGGK